MRDNVTSHYVKTTVKTEREKERERESQFSANQWMFLTCKNYNLCYEDIYMIVVSCVTSTTITYVYVFQILSWLSSDKK